MTKSHSFKPGDRVQFWAKGSDYKKSPESYHGTITHIYETSNTIVVKWDDGDHAQIDAQELLSPNC